MSHNIDPQLGPDTVVGIANAADATWTTLSLVVVHLDGGSALDPNAAVIAEKVDKGKAPSNKEEKKPSTDEQRGFVAAKDDDWQHADIYTRSAPGPKKGSEKAKACLFLGTCCGVFACCTNK